MNCQLGTSMFWDHSDINKSLFEIKVLNEVIRKTLLKPHYLIMNDASNIQVDRSTCSRPLRSYSWSRRHRCDMAWTDTDPPWSHSDDLKFGGIT